MACLTFKMQFLKFQKICALKVIAVIAIFSLKQISNEGTSHGFTQEDLQIFKQIEENGGGI